LRQPQVSSEAAETILRALHHIRWADVDFERQRVCVGDDADTKNREARHVDFNRALEAHLCEMQKRRAPDS
jgi:hypothetical protein